VEKTILITGCSGQLGNKLYEDLSAQFNVIPTYKHHRDKKNKLDITSTTDCNFIFSNYNPDIIINCAALTNVDSCERNKKLCRDINVIGLGKLIALSDINTKIIHISSDYVFDGLFGNYREEGPTYPVNYYGKSKLESENILIGSNRKYLIFRVSMLFDKINNNFFSWVLGNLKNQQKIKVATDMFSTPTWISSFSNMIIKSIHLDLSGIFHYGSQDSISRFDFASLIASEFNYPSALILPVESKEINFYAERPKNTSLVSEKISTYIDTDIYELKYILKLINKL